LTVTPGAVERRIIADENGTVAITAELVFGGWHSQLDRLRRCRPARARLGAR
jgi:hypothetical protein